MMDWLCNADPNAHYGDTAIQGRMEYVIDMITALQSQGKKVSGPTLHEIIKEMDTNQNGQVELEEYLQVRFHMALDQLRTRSVVSCTTPTCNKIVHCME